MRHPDDFYETPAWCVEAILPYLPPLDGKVILDPACGNGAILRAIAANVPPQTTFALCGLELDADRATQAKATFGPNIVHTDALAQWAWVSVPPALTIMNPPYKLAMEFVQKAIEEADGNPVFALLRLGFLASQKRAYWLRENTPSVFILPKRPSFTANGKTDHSDYAWMAWGLGEPRVVIL